MGYAFWKLIITLKQSGSILVPFLYYRCIRNCVESRIDSYSHGILYSQLNSVIEVLLRVLRELIENLKLDNNSLTCGAIE